MPKQIFLNLPVKDLRMSIGFFKALGFVFDPKFSDDKGAGMIIEDGASYAMLLTQPFFQQFTKKAIADSTKTTEVLIAISVDSKDEVDDMIAKAIAAGGNEPREPQDHGWMYGRSFEDLDGHIWEVFFLDETMMPQE